jgi:hypothetical protein
MPLLQQVNTLDDLLKLVAKQKATTQKAVRELHNEMDSTAMLYKADRTLSENTSQEITRRIHALLFKYASLPTLTEFYQNPSWDGGFVWGGSFGVSAIVGSVFLNSWAEIFPEFTRILKPVTLKILEEHVLADAAEVDKTPLIDRILPSMKFTIRDQNGIEILGEQRDKMIYAKVASLLQLVAQVFVSYGILDLVEDDDDSGEMAAKLTPLGHRVFLHLKDVEVYIGEVAELYPKLSKDKLSEISDLSFQ